MKFHVSTIGCEKEYGERRLVVEDEQIGDITITEMEIDSLEELVELADEVDRIEFEKSNWEKYDGNLTFICGNL